MSEAPKRGPSVVLIVSLCLNLALIGLIAIAMTRGPRGFEPHEPKGGLSAQALIRMVPAEESKIRSIMEAHHARVHELRGDAMRARAESFGVLSSPEFREDDFAKSLADVEKADAALQSEIMKLTAESVASLTPAERQVVAAKVKRPDRSWFKRFMRGS
jgi:uncharacterized membrane protein